MLEENEDYVGEDDFDYSEYDNSIANRIKQAYICLVACMATVYMVIGVRNYWRIHKHWSKVMTLFVCQTVCIIYLVYNEFTGRNIQGIFIILVFTQYSMFLGFTIIMDSMIRPIDDAVSTEVTLRMFNKIFRTCMHLVSWALFISSFWMDSCYGHIYPKNFIAVVCVILIHQLYDIILHYRGYMIDWDNLPPKSPNRLRYNKEMFLKQSKCFFIANLAFGTLSFLTVACGYFVVNRTNEKGYKQHLLCINGDEWIYLSPVGNIFGTLHQLLILMQINIT